MILRLDFPILSLNKMLRWHWSTRDRHLEQWEWVIRAALKGPPKRAEGKRLVKIFSYRKNILDHDNFVGGAKPVLDALRNLGLIKNDDPAHVDVSYHQIPVRGDKARTEIHIEEVTNG